MIQELFDLHGKTALVSGGSRGIGRPISIGLAEAGADVAVIYRSRKEEADSLCEHISSLGRRAQAFQQDIGNVDEVADTAHRIIDQMGAVDIVVNNAALADLQPFTKITPDSFDRLMRVNVTGPFFMTQQFAQHMIDRGKGGRIINTTSTNGFVAEALLCDYNATKGALEMITRSMAIELGRHNITVNSIAPGLIDTEISLGFDLEPAFWDYARQHCPLGRLGQAEDCAGAVMLLASEAGRYITGQHIIIDGGLLCEQFPRMQFYKKDLA